MAGRNIGLYYPGGGGFQEQVPGAEVPVNNAILQPVPGGGFSTTSSAPDVGQLSQMAGDWFSQNVPTGGFLPVNRDMRMSDMNGNIVGGQNVDALIQQFQQSHGVDTPISELASFLQQNGVNAQVATHGVGAVNGIGGDQISGDKLIINGRILDSKYNEGGSDARWQLNWEDPNAGGNGAMPSGNGGFIGAGGGFGSLAQGFDERLNPPSAQDILNDPLFEARLKAGTEAIERSAASKGTLLTGGTLKDLTSFSGDLAQGIGNDLFNRNLASMGFNRGSFYQNQDNLFNRNFDLARLGQNSAAGVGDLGRSYGTQAGNLITDIGNAQATGTVSSANNIGGAISNIGNQLYLNNLLRQGSNA